MKSSCLRSPLGVGVRSCSNRTAVQARATRHRCGRHSSTSRIDLNRYPDPPAQSGENLHLPIQREGSESPVANARHIHARGTRRLFGVAHCQAALVKHRNHRRRNERLGSSPVGVGLGEVRMDVDTAPLDQLELVLVHRTSSLLSRPNRARTRSISAFGVLVPVLDFF